MIRNNRVEELRAEGSSVVRVKYFYVVYVQRMHFTQNFYGTTSLKDILALARTLSFIMRSIQISILPSTTFFVFFFLSFFRP